MTAMEMLIININSVTINKDVEEGGLVNRTEALKDNSTRLWTEANETQSDLKSA